MGRQVAGGGTPQAIQQHQYRKCHAAANVDVLSAGDDSLLPHVGTPQSWRMALELWEATNVWEDDEVEALYESCATLASKANYPDLDTRLTQDANSILALP